MNKVNEKFSVIQLTPSDWKDYKSIRLEALAAHPNFFCPSRDETKFTEEDWKQRLSNLNAETFGLYGFYSLDGGSVSKIRDILDI